MNQTDRTSDPVSSNDITRRSFLKKSALTAGAITLLGQGIGLAANPSSKLFKKIFEYRLALSSFPKGEAGSGNTGDWQHGTYEVWEYGSNIGSITLTTVIAACPDPSLKLTEEEITTGEIASGKLKSSFIYQTKGKLDYNAFWGNILHRNDSSCPSEGYVDSPSLTVTLEKFNDERTWTEGQQIPEDPPNPDKTYNVPDEDDRSTGSDDSFLAVACKWMQDGHQWGGMLSTDPGKLDIKGTIPTKWFTAYVKFTADFSYSSKSGEQSWAWSFPIAKRSRVDYSVDNGTTYTQGTWEKWKILHY